jgi:hypothetical protein
MALTEATLDLSTAADPRNWRLGGFFSQDVALKRLTPLDRSAAANLKALCSTFLGFHLRHLISVYLKLCSVGAWHVARFAC